MTKSQSMKKLIIALAALTLLCAPAGAQGFLNKLKEKASEAVGNVVSGAIGEKIQDAIPESLKGAASQAEAPTAVTGEQALPPRRESTFGWDGPVTPSSASFPIPLMNEFPAVPAAASLANPVEMELTLSGIRIDVDLLSTQLVHIVSQQNAEFSVRLRICSKPLHHRP